MTGKRVLMISGAIGLFESGSKLCLVDAFVHGSSKAIFGQTLKQGVNSVFDILKAKDTRD
jgi:hypothetical protein